MNGNLSEILIQRTRPVNSRIAVILLHFVTLPILQYGNLSSLYLSAREISLL